MTVRELISLLEPLDLDMEIILSHDVEGTGFQDIDPFIVNMVGLGYKVNRFCIYPDGYISDNDL